jgi:hypothetical protein
VYYEFAITVPANTAESSPVDEDLELCKGVIHRIEVQFPIGTRALTHCRLAHHSFGNLPTNNQGSFSSDGYTVPCDENLEFYSEPYVVKATLWNDDDTYEHTVTIRFGILESKTALMLLSVIKGLMKMLKLMGIKV